jgi:hypothetical protein
MRRTARANWRRLIEDLTDDQKHPHNGGLWRLSRWSRRVAGKAHTDPHIPALRRHEEEEPTEDNIERARILAEKFFPPPPRTTHTQTAREAQPADTVQISREVTKEEVAEVLEHLPPGKAPGPDGIPNEILKALAQEISEGLAYGISTAFARGELPSRYKESVTIALRKEGKKDYSLPSSYRPIALENTLAKVVEKVLANRLVHAAERYTLLPWTQMGARKQRSTMSAIGLLTSCVQTAWHAKPGSVVSMLSLDLAGAYDNVPHDKLLEILRGKRLPEWMIKAIACFTQGRRTRIAYTGFESDWIYTCTGIPQGSPLSPILFLFFISGLLERFQEPEDGILGFGFVDDTNLITWGASAAENCRKLTTAHSQCEEWAREHSAQFAPDKYQLIHFTRRRRHANEDLASTVQIGSHQVELQNKAIRVLGVWLDPALTWKEHISHVTRKGLAASEALSRLANSTWGPSARHSRLLYTAVVRPTLLHGAQEWSAQSTGKPIAATTIKPLHRVQNECLRKITGAYRRTPRAAMERETRVMPVDLYLEVVKYRQADRTRGHEVESQIARTADAVWRRMRRRTTHQRPPTGREIAANQASERAQEMRERIERNHSHTPRAPSSHTPRRHPLRSPRILDNALLIRRWGELAWEERWKTTVRKRPARRPAAVWRTAWTQDPRTLYVGLTKAEATALFLMRTEVIGLNAWLAAVQVPGITPACPCGWHTQTVRHILLHCPRHNRTGLLRACGTERMDDILMRPECARHAARWLVRTGVLEQFRTAAEIATEETEGYRPFQDAEEW